MKLSKRIKRFWEDLKFFMRNAESRLPLSYIRYHKQLKKWRRKCEYGVKEK